MNARARAFRMLSLYRFKPSAVRILVSVYERPSAPPAWLSRRYKRRQWTRAGAAAAS